jgi:Ca2+-binding EF-hand superfamily protein
MFAETIKERKKMKLKKFNETINKTKKFNNKKGWISAKNILNESKIKEKLNDNNNEIKNLEGIVDLEKIKNIRKKLVERYNVRKNLNTMFRLWDINNTGEINLFDAYEMINKIGFDINYNETRVLISLVNKRKNEMMNLSEFLNLIADKEIDWNSVDLKNIPFKNEDYFQSVKKENIKKMQNKYFDENRNKKNKIDDEILIKTDEISFLEEFFRLKIPKLAKKIREFSGNEKFVDFNGFKKIICDFNLPKKYCEENVLKNFFNKYLIDNNNNKNFNFEKFAQTSIKNSIGVSEKNDFFFVKDKNLDYLQKKIINSKSEINLSKKKLENFEQKKNPF